MEPIATSIIVIAAGTLLYEYIRNRQGVIAVGDDVSNLEGLDQVIEAYQLEESDQKMVADCRDLLERTFDGAPNVAINERIIRQISSMTKEQRMLFFRQFTYKVADIMGVDISDVKFYEADHPWGFYQYSDNCISLSVVSLCIDNQLPDAIATIFHEVKHCVQLNAIKPNGNRWGYSMETLVSWVYAFRNYVKPEDSIFHYFIQSIELNAFVFEHEVLPTPSNTIKTH